MLLRREATAAAAAAASNQTRTIVVCVFAYKEQEKTRQIKPYSLICSETLDLIRFLNWICSMPYFAFCFRNRCDLFPKFSKISNLLERFGWGCTVGNSIPKSSLLPIEIKYGNEPWKMMPSFPFYYKSLI